MANIEKMKNNQIFDFLIILKLRLQTIKKFKNVFHIQKLLALTIIKFCIINKTIKV